MTFGEGSTYGVTLDPRWTHGTFTDRKDPDTTWMLPFIGWTTEVVWTDDPGASKGANGIRVVPLFWDDESRSAVTERGQQDTTGITATLTELHGESPRPVTSTGLAADGAWYSVWLHGNWRWLTQNMTTEQREHAAAAVERCWEHLHEGTGDGVDPDTVTDLRWWRTA